MQYGYTRTVALAFDAAVAKTKEALAQQGFGILTEIDVKATLKKKLDVDYDSYVILGACNPPLAYQALTAEKEIGLFLPCNVIVYVADGSVHVSAVLPTAAMSMIENPSLTAIATEVEGKLKQVVDAI